MSETVIESIRARLAHFSPLSLDIRDDSQRHKGHEGAKDGGGHYHVTIVSEDFHGKNSLARHRMIYKAVEDLMPLKIHALAIRAVTPEEGHF